MGILKVLTFGKKVNYMKIGITLMVAGMLMASCSDAQHSGEQGGTTNSNQESAQSQSVAKVISPEEFKSLIGKEGYQLVDVRTEPEYTGGHIGDAKNINFFDADFKEQISQLDKTKPVLIYCASGNRSGKAMLVMKELGFSEIYDLKGGYGSWPY